MDSSLSSELSPQSKRHSFPAILSYSETLSVLSEHQRQYNDKEIIRRCNTPTINPKGTDEERQQRLQQAVEWLKHELKDMYHQDKFLLRQFHHLNRSIQDLKEKREIKEKFGESEVMEDQPSYGKLQQEQPKQTQLEKERVEDTRFKQEKKQGKVEQNQFKQEDFKQEKRSLNEYDSDYGSDQSMDRFEDDWQTLKNNVIRDASPKMAPKQRSTKRWTWWK